MRAIVLLGVMALVGLAIFGVLSSMQRQTAEKMVQDDASGFFREKKEEKAAAMDLGQETVKQTTPVSASSSSSWMDSLENVLGNCLRIIKNLPTSLGFRSQAKTPSPTLDRTSSRTSVSRSAPGSVYFTLIYLSVRTQSGITGFEPGTQVVCVKDEGPVLLVQAGNLQFEAQRQYLTSGLGSANLELGATPKPNKR